jgi:hypothetical protein
MKGYQRPHVRLGRPVGQVRVGVDDAAVVDAGARDGLVVDPPTTAVDGGALVPVTRPTAAGPETKVDDGSG